MKLGKTLKNGTKNWIFQNIAQLRITVTKMIPQSQAFNRLTISRHDFERCLEFLSLLNWSNYGAASYEALLLTSIIFYARAFSCNERDKNSNATPKVDDQVIDHLSPKEKQLHEKILTLRNKAVAHARASPIVSAIAR